MDKEVAVDVGGAAVVLVFEEDFLLGLAEEDLGSDDTGGREEEEVVVLVYDFDSFLDDVNAASDDGDADDDKDVGDDALFAVNFGDTGCGSLNELTGTCSSDDTWLLCRMTFRIRIGLM